MTPDGAFDSLLGESFRIAGESTEGSPTTYHTTRLTIGTPSAPDCTSKARCEPVIPYVTRSMPAERGTVLKAILSLLAVLVFLVTVAEAQVGVRGYFRKDGTYVAPHQRSLPNTTIKDNYNYPDNFNPNTGRMTPGDPYRRDRDQDSIPDALDPTPYGTRPRTGGGLWGK